MQESFDPYHRWLGIPPQQQPPNHYRLLGIELFESDPHVISNAADRQMAHVRSYQLGVHGEFSQRILNELGAAKVCLLDPSRKVAYDAQLKERLESSAQSFTNTTQAPVVNPLTPPLDPPHRSHELRPRSGKLSQLRTAVPPARRSAISAPVRSAVRKPGSLLLGARILKQTVAAAADFAVVGGPIVIGIAGGLLLVLIIILLLLFSKPSTESASARAPAGAGTVGMPQPPQEQQPAAAAVPRPEVQTPTVPTPAVQTPAGEPPKPVEPPAPASQPNPAELKPAQASDQPPADQEGVSTHGSQGKRKKDRDQPKTPEPAEAPSGPAKTEPSPATSAKPETSVQPPESPPAPEVAKPAEEPKPTEQPPEVPQADPDKLFAELTEFALELKPGGDPKSVPKEMARGLEFLAQSIRTKLQASSKTIDLEVVEQSSKAKMEVTMTPSLEPPYLALSLGAQLKCTTSGGGSVVVWTGDTKEVFRFIPAQFDAKSTPRVWEEKVIEFFKPLGKAHREAKAKPSKKE